MPKNNFWIFTADHSGLPLALRLKEEGNNSTLVMVKPQERNGRTETPKTPEEAKENHKRIQYLEKNASGLVDKMWAAEALYKIKPTDYVIFDQIYGWQYGEMLRKRGVKVLGGSQSGYQLETERRDTLALLKSVGMDVPLQKYFGAGSSKKAIDFLSKAGDDILFVFKSDNPKVLTQVAYDSNEELIQKLNTESKAIDTDGFLLQQKVEGIEAAVETWLSNGKPILANIDLEAKKKYNEMSEVQTGCSFQLLWNIEVDHPLREKVNGPLDQLMAKYIKTGLFDLSFIYEPKEDKFWVLEMCGCFDPETEILTNRGWMKYDEVCFGDYALSLNPNNDDIAWKKINNIQLYPYIGKVAEIGNSKFKAHSSFDAIATLNHNWVVNSRLGKRKISKSSELVNGDQIVRTGCWIGSDKKFITIPAYKDKPAIDVNAENFMRFIGMYLSEGCVDSYYKDVPRRISISQPTNKRMTMKIALERLPFKYTESSNGFRISDTQLGNYFNYLKLSGKKSFEKFIPFEFKQLSRNCLLALIEGFTWGDGHITESGKLSMFTTSKILADDLQEIVHKSGWVANISKRKSAGTKMCVRNGDTYTRNHDLFVVTIRFSKTNFQVSTSNNQNLNYREVDYNGLVWCAEVDEWHTFFARRNGKAYFSGNSRFPYNAFYALMALLEVPLGEFFVKYLNGEYKTDIGQTVFCDEFAGSLRIFNDENTPDQRVDIDKEYKENFWLWDVYKKGGELLTTGYDSLGIVTATGENPEAAMAKVREYYFKLHMPTKWARDDFDEDYDNGLPLARYHQMKRMSLI